MWNFIHNSMHHPLNTPNRSIRPNNREIINNIVHLLATHIEAKPTPITLVTCWYTLRSKFSPQKYMGWIQNFMSIVKNFNLVIYTDNKSFFVLLPLLKKDDRIKVIIKPMTDFYTYKYSKNWIVNHDSSSMTLHKIIDWELNMLWNEKIFFIKDALINRYFETPIYGWCDIGYFRNGLDDLDTSVLCSWPNPQTLEKETFNNHIHYGRVQNNDKLYKQLESDILNHYSNHLNTPPTNKYNEISFAGGFFIMPQKHVETYAKLYDDKLKYYFDNNYFIKDDQMIVMDIIFTNPQLFHIHQERDARFNNWFMFQRILL